MQDVSQFKCLQRVASYIYIYIFSETDHPQGFPEMPILEITIDFTTILKGDSEDLAVIEVRGILGDLEAILSDL